MTCRRGDIVLVLFPDSNLLTSKRRPALVVQSDGKVSDLPQTIVAMITSNMSRAGFPSSVPFEMTPSVACDVEVVGSKGVEAGEIREGFGTGQVLRGHRDREGKGHVEIDPAATGHHRQERDLPNPESATRTSGTPDRDNRVSVAPEDN